MNKEKIVNDILREYAFLSDDGGTTFNSKEVACDKLITAIENCGYSNYFSSQHLLETLFTVDKADHLTNDDINILKRFVGDRWNITDAELKSFNPSKAAIPDDFPGSERDPRRISHKKMEDILKFELREGRKLKLTLSPTRVKIYAGGVTISRFNIGIGLRINSKNFLEFLRLVDFYKQHQSEIEIATSESPGLMAQKTQVDQLNGYFENNNPQKAKFHLYIRDGADTVDGGVMVDNASNVAGTGKADITLLNDKTDVFWISFKAADYFDKTGSGLSRIGFKHYGPSISIGEKLADDPTWKSLMVKLVDGIKTNMATSYLDLSNAEVMFNPKTDVITRINGTPIMKVVNNDKEKIRFLISKSAAVKKLMLKEGVQKKFLYFTPKGFSVKMDFLDGTDITKEIAGKAIYGVDFKMDKSTPFGSENVNVLMQSSTPITVSPTENTNGELSILIQTNERGHVLFNPNLPLPKNMADPILQYRPVFHPSYLENEVHSETIGDTAYLFLGLRIFIRPDGKVPKNSINLS